MSLAKLESLNGQGSMRISNRLLFPEAGAAKVCDDLAEGESKLAELEVAQKKLRAL